jgi:hypothetical protein
MAEETQYTANNGMGVVSTANTNLDGTGTGVVDIITGASNGTLLKCAWIKAEQTTTEGIVRLFVNDGGTNTYLLMEVKIDPVTPSATDTSFERRIPLNFTLKSGYKIKATTQNAETFGIIIEGMDWAYHANSVRTDTTKYTAVTGLATIDTANSNLNGTGTIALAFQYNIAAGISIESITIKSIVNNTLGMVRLYLQDSGGINTILFHEVHVPACTKSGTWPAFEHTVTFEGYFELQNNYSLYASTENGETFKLFTVGLARSYSA